MTFTLATSGKCVGKHVKENVKCNFINFFHAENSIFFFFFSEIFEWQSTWKDYCVLRMKNFKEIYKIKFRPHAKLL